MNRFRVVATIICLTLVALALPSPVNADASDKKTIVTFSQPVEIPGAQVLPAGTYVFKLLDSSSNRNIVQIFNEAKTTSTQRSSRSPTPVCRRPTKRS